MTPSVNVALRLQGDATPKNDIMWFRQSRQKNVWIERGVSAAASASLIGGILLTQQLFVFRNNLLQNVIKNSKLTTAPHNLSKVCIELRRVDGDIENDPCV